MIPAQPQLSVNPSSTATASGGDDKNAQHQNTLTKISTDVNSGAGARGPVFNFGGTLDASATNAPKGVPTWLVITAGVIVIGLAAFLIIRKKP